MQYTNIYNTDHTIDTTIDTIDTNDYDPEFIKYLKNSEIIFNTLDANVLNEIYIQYLNDKKILNEDLNSNSDSESDSDLEPDEYDEEFQEKQNKKLIYNACYEMAITNIPEMTITSEIIILNGFINNKPLRILVDTGASVSLIFSNVIDKLNLSDFVDTRKKKQLTGIGTGNTIGNLWYIELTLEDMNFPISLTVSDSNIEQFDIILGINFLRSYNAVIDFKNKILRLNDKYNIIFSYEKFSTS